MNNFLIGFGVGLAAGTLFAPKSGVETRKYIADKATEGGQFLVHQGEQIKDAATDLLENGRNVIASQMEKLAEIVGGQRQYSR